MFKKRQEYPDDKMDRLIASLVHLWKDPQDYLLIALAIQKLDARYDLHKKLTREPGVAEIIEQMVGRLAKSYQRLSDLKDKRILDIACGSNTSKMPGAVYVNTPFGEITLGAKQGYTALFEPWFCRMLVELHAIPVGVDFGDLEHEVFEHQRLDLGVEGALDILHEASFDAIHDSRLFGSPEFTAQFPQPADRLRVAREIVQQEQRVLKPNGKIIHSDAMDLFK
jgi:SAM-dependent methyltransferase